MNSFEEFRDMWMEETAHLRDKNSYLYVVVYPDNLEWNFHIEKQTQTTCLMTSGGITGAGTGHEQVLCHQSEVNDVLKHSTKSHAMIVTIGMVFDMTTNRTPIKRFWEFAESGEYCKAHIIAKPGYAAYLHHQHIELNVDMWKTLGCPDIYERWEDFTRSSANFHDDYTPPWISPEGLPMIHNFSESDRVFKAFAYHMDNREKIQKENWENIQANREGWRNRVTVDDPYFRILMTRMMTEVFYAENTEYHKKLPKENFNLIITPAAGYSGEAFADQLDFDGDIVFYDYSPENLIIKKRIVDMNMSINEVKRYFKHTRIRYTDSRLKDRAESFPEVKEAIADKYDIEYWNMDLINMNYNRLLKKVKQKRVFFDFSNIFGYHVSHAIYTLDYLIRTYDHIESFLKEHTEHYYIQGKRPGKQDIMEINRESDVRWQYLKNV